MDTPQLEFLARQPSARLQARERFWGMPKRGLAFLLANVMFWQPLWAQAEDIVVSGAGTTLSAAGNGVPIVNIATPDASGLSHNQFSDYNVGTQGVILNNATEQTQTTQLGGGILGNPNLNSHAASTILNEVTSNNRSQLRGYTEVAGQAARVIIANPYGITCDGCGFINTPRATLTTGKPLFDDGRLRRFEVDGGDVLIDGAGINANNVDSFEVITRSATINGQINARHFSVIAGHNDVDADTLAPTARADDGSSQPLLAIDSTSLGGMYANTIRLVGTERGVGVHLAGHMAASAGDIHIDANGHLSVGQMAASGAINVQAASLEAQGHAYAARINLRTEGDLQVAQSLAAQETITLSAGGKLINRGVIEAGINADNSRNDLGDVSLRAREIDNAGHTITASRSLDINASILDNRAGTVVGGHALSVGAASIDNRGGKLASQRQLALVADTLDNRGGTLAANGPLSATVKDTLDNSADGLIASQGSSVQLHAGRFDNRQGTLQAQADLTLDIGGLLSNDGGRINARTGSANIRHGAFDNASGGLYALGNITLIGDSFSNASDGQVSGQVIDMTLRGALINHGIIESNTHLALRAASLDNRNGQIRALASAADGTGANRQASSLSITGLLDNRDGILEFANTDLNTQLGSLLNSAGQLLHVGTGTLGVATAHLLEAGGSIISHGLMTLEGTDLTNRTVLQAGHLNVNADSFTQTTTGKLLATRAFTGNGVDWRNDGSIASQGAFDLTLRGTYSGDGQLTSNADFSLRAAHLATGSNAIIASAANAQVNISGLLDNAGRISSSGHLTVSANSVRNSGSLGSAGQLIVTADSLVNDQGLIFSGTDMGLRVASLTNLGGALYSLGSLRIDRDGQGTLADSIVNSSGSIQSDGTMALLAHSIDNLRTVLTLGDPGIYTALIEYLGCLDGDCRGPKVNMAWRVTQYQKLEVLEASAASSITAGGDLTLKGGQLRNLSSSIATGGALFAELASLINRGVEPGDTVTSRTYRSARTTNPRPWHNLANAFNKQYWKDGAHYDRSQLGGLEAALAKFIGTTHLEYQHLYNQTLTPLAGQSYAAVIQAAGPATVTTQNGIDNSVVRSGYHYIGAGKRADTSTPGSEYATHVGLNRQLAPDLTQQQVDPTTLPGFSLPTGQNGLFALASTAANAPHKYLIETNALLTALKPATSSDYLLANLGHDPDIPEKPEAAATPDNPAPPLKRLGDGFYEQRLIQQAVLARTGLRYLDGMTSDDAMFKHLMNNALASKAALNLTLGTQLSSEQVAALTHDIVWMEYTVVNGESVLAPVLYLAHANNRLAPNGALIQASDLELITGTQLNNTGTLRASNAMRLRAGDNFINEGLTEARDRLEVLAVNNVINRAGGIIKGPDVSLIAIKGDVLNERTVTTHTSSSGERAEQTSFVDSPARIEAPGALTFEAGQDVNIVGGVVDGGDIAIKAAKDVNIIAAQQVDSDLMKDSNDQTIKQHGSVVRADGNLRVEAGNDAFIGASTVEVEGALTAVVGRDMIISAQADERHSASKSRTVKAKSDQVQQVPTTLGAKTITLVAGQNMTIGASHLRATHQAYLYAAKDLNVPALQDHDYQLYDKKKKSGFGALEAKRDEVTRITHVGSTITTGADLLMRSGNDQLYQAATLDSGQALTLDSGGAITFEGVKDLVDESHTQTNNNAFWNASKGKGHTDETLRQTALIAQGSRAVNAVSGLQIDVKQINQQTVSQSIDAMVKADPNLAWIKAAQERGDVDWRQVKEIHESFKYDTAGLGPASQLIIAIALAVALAPMAAGAAANAGAGTVVAAGAGAVAAVAATNATVSVINNRGSLGSVVQDLTSADAMKGYAVSALTAGAFAYADASWFSAAEKAGSAVQGAAAGSSSTLQASASAKNVITLANASDTLVRAGTRAAIGSGISTAIKGGSLRDNLAAALVAEASSIAMATSFNWVGDNVRFPDGSAQKVMAHALVGGLLAEATGSDFKTGAAAAGLNELLIDQMADVVKGDNNLQLALSQITGVVAAVAVNGDIEKGAEVAQSATAHNYLTHDQLARAAKRLASCAPDSGCYRETLRAFTELSLQQDIQALVDCASAAALCKGPSLDVQNATTVLNDVRDLVADSSPQAIRDLDELIRLNLGVQEMLAVGTVSHTTDALLDTLKANRVLSDAQIVEAREQFAAATSGLAAARTGNAPAAQLAKDIVLSTASDGAKGAATALETTSPVVVTGKRAIDKAQSYEGALRDVYGNVPYAERQYTTIVNGQRVNGVADNVTIVNGQRTAVEAKFVEDWGSSLRNPASSVGSKPWSTAEQTKMVDQANKYSSGFEGGVIYHTNSPELASHYSKIFNESGVKNFKFVITPVKN